jgi:selenocysteine lyase/cysteine desulfurase
VTGAGEPRLAHLVGDEVTVPCVDGTVRTYVGLDAGASTAALDAVGERVREFLPWYSSVHRGAGAKSQVSTRAYEEAREAMLAFCGRTDRDDVAVLCRNTTEAINIAAHRLRLGPGDTIVTTVVEHHANLLPWQRVAHERGVTISYVECDERGIFGAADIAAAVEAADRPALVAVTGATNVTGWLPPLDPIVEHAHAHGARVLVDAAQLAPHRPMDRGGALAADFVAWSGHKMYAPFGTGVLVGPREVFAEGDPFLVGGGAVNLVDLDDVVWTDPPDRDEAGSPNVIGAVALHAAVDQLLALGWEAIVAHELELADRLRRGLAAIDGVRLLGPSPGDPEVDGAMLAVGTFAIDGIAHPLVAARLSAEYAIGVRHGCFCAHPYLVRLLGLSTAETARYRHDIVTGDRRDIPGAVRASASISTTVADVEQFLGAVDDLASGKPAPVTYVQDPATGDYSPAP